MGGGKISSVHYMSNFGKRIWGAKGKARRAKVGGLKGRERG